MFLRSIAFVFVCLSLTIQSGSAQQSGPVWQANPQPATEPAAVHFYSTVSTYVNPVLPGDHPDPTLLKVGNDFYHCGSSFHFNPYLPIYHSTDLVHWKVMSRVLLPNHSGMVTDRPGNGVWQGAITYFYGAYRIYFSSGGQWFSTASSPAGPWSAPVRVKENAQTGPLGYDNSIFVDDDGKPYMVIKNGQKVNRLQALGEDGQLTDSVINLDWINANLQYSWAEGPVMCKRNGYYYYFPAGDVSGGQYVLRTTALTADSSKWERLGDFFKPITDVNNTFPRPNHISAPVQLADGSWWTIGQSYEKRGNNDWSGMGRQTSLYRVVWEGDRPWGEAPVSGPVVKPALDNNNTPWRSVRTDRFDTDSLGPWWHFLTQPAAAGYSLTQRKGWLRLSPDSGRAHLLQKETDHYYTAVTRVNVENGARNAHGGIYLTNGKQSVFARLYYHPGNNARIVFQLDTAVREIPYRKGKEVWLKLERFEHQLTGFFSTDGNNWQQVGPPINAVAIDKAQPDFNSWVGTSIGLFAEGGPVDFRFFVCKDGFSSLPAVGSSNYYGISKTKQGITNTSIQGGWLMISGVDFGTAGEAKRVELVGQATHGGQLELLTDDLKKGVKIAVVQVKPGGQQLHTGRLQQVSGQHDLFVRFPVGPSGDISIQSIRVLKTDK